MTTAPEHAPDLQDGAVFLQRLGALRQQLADALLRVGDTARELAQEAPPELVAALHAIEAKNRRITR